MVLSVVYIVATTGSFFVMVLVDPPRQWAQVTAFQDGCVRVMGLAGVLGLLAVILGNVGFARKPSAPSAPRVQVEQSG